MTIQLSASRVEPAQQPDTPLSPPCAAVLRSLKTLSRRTQRIFLFSRLDGLPYADIGRLLELEIDCVEQAMLRVLINSHRCNSTLLTPAVDAVNHQASRWYVHLQSPQATASQRIEFRHWLDADLAHLIAFQATERLWRQLQGPAAALGAHGWHWRKRRVVLGWWLITAFLGGLLVTAEAFSCLVK